jgi:hypothetical protein
MKILITGMSASQASLRVNSKTLGFAGAVHKVLTASGDDVVMTDPDIRWTLDDLKDYDVVIVGVSPITSLAASKSYGALHVIDLLADDPRLKLMVDAPYPSQIAASLRAVMSNPGNLTKDFYAFRQGYQLAASESVSKRLLGTVDRLLNGHWADTIYPSLPWQNRSDITKTLPTGAASALTGINLDSWLVSETPIESTETVNKWVADSTMSTWTKKIHKTLSYPLVAMKHDKTMGDVEVGHQIGRSVGSLITPHRDGTWWTYRYIQSLNHAVPVVTEWKEAQAIGTAWSTLAATIEGMTPNERQDLAWGQLTEYMSEVPRRAAAADELRTLLQATTRKESYAV